MNLGTIVLPLSAQKFLILSFFFLSKVVRQHSEDSFLMQKAKGKNTVSLRDEVLIKDKFDTGRGFYTIIATDYTVFATEVFSHRGHREHRDIATMD